MRATLRGFVSDSKCHNLSRFKCVTWVISFVISRQTLVIYLHFNEKWSFLKIWILLHLDIFHTKFFWAKMWFFTKKIRWGISCFDWKDEFQKLSHPKWRKLGFAIFSFKNIFKNSKQSQNQNKLWFQQFGDNLVSINSPFAGDYDAKMKFYCQK